MDEMYSRKIHVKVAHYNIFLTLSFSLSNNFIRASRIFLPVSSRMKQRVCPHDPSGLCATFELMSKWTSSIANYGLYPEKNRRKTYIRSMVASSGFAFLIRPSSPTTTIAVDGGGMPSNHHPITHHRHHHHIYQQHHILLPPLPSVALSMLQNGGGDGDRLGSKEEDI